MKEIVPIHSPIDARIRVPGSKSITNRALVCAALAQGESSIRNASDSDDTARMINGLNQLGVLVRKHGDVLIVGGTGGKLYAPKFPIPVGNAGTTLRFLLALAALAQGTTILEADQRMAERPNDELLNALRGLGVEVEQCGSRFVVRGGTSVGGDVRLDVRRSSQFLSSLMMITPYASHDISIRLEGRISSKSYVEMTKQVMKHFGIEVERRSDTSFSITQGRYVPTDFIVEADASSASYFLSAAAICGGRVFVQGLKQNSMQSDAKYSDVLRLMGCTITQDRDGIGCRSDGALHGLEIDLNSMPDGVPTLAVVALFADSPTRIVNIAHLRYKESDRLAALERELRKLGANITVTNDSLTIVPSPLCGTQLETYDDHRLAMSFAIAGLKIPGVKIENPQSVRKSFPRFWDEFEKITLTPLT